MRSSKLGATTEYNMETTLYKKDAKGKIRTWAISMDNVDGYRLNIQHGELGGAQQLKVEEVKTGLASRTVEEQAKSRYYSRINEAYRKGYKDTLQEAHAGYGTNSLGLPKPMLAKKIKEVKGIEYDNAFLQRKYDGHRCIIIKKKGEILAYSKEGSLITTIGHITKDLRLFEGESLDGELYCHGYKLQTLASWIKREQEATLNLNYMVYDCISSDPFADRLDTITAHVFRANSPKISVVPTHKVQDPAIVTGKQSYTI